MSKMEFQHDIFYNIESQGEDTRLRIITEAMEMSDNIEIDKIVGWQRQQQPKEDPQEWLIKNLRPNSMWRMIWRRGYSNPYHGQVVIRENGDFLWVNISEEQLTQLVEKYELKTI